MNRRCVFVAGLALLVAWGCMGSVDRDAIQVLNSLVRPGLEIALNKPCDTTYAIGEPITMSFTSERASYVIRS